MKIVIIGADGQLGRDLLRATQEAGHEVKPYMGPEELDVTCDEAVAAAISEQRPEIAISTAARCDVDACETDTLNAFAVNAVGAGHVARACQENGARFIHMSTDYVFSGDKGSPYLEADAPNPINAYGITKLAGEHFVQAYCEDHLIVRSSGLYGVAGSREKGGNFVETMVRLSADRPELKGVSDQTLSPTYTRDLALAIVELAATKARGIVHLCNEGACSWYDWAQETFELLGRTTRLDPVPMDSFPSVARRPKFTALESRVMGDLGLGSLPPWRDALKRYLEEKGHLL